MVAGTREVRLESDPLAFEDIDRNLIKNKTRVSISHSRPEESSARINCEPAAELVRRVRGVSER